MPCSQYRRFKGTSCLHNQSRASHPQKKRRLGNGKCTSKATNRGALISRSTDAPQRMQMSYFCRILTHTITGRQTSTEVHNMSLKGKANRRISATILRESAKITTERHGRDVTKGSALITRLVEWICWDSLYFPQSLQANVQTVPKIGQRFQTTSGLTRLLLTL